MTITFRWVAADSLRCHPLHRLDNPTNHPMFAQLCEHMSDGWDVSHPAVVRPARDFETGEHLNNGTYDVLVGNRRLKAAIQLGIKSIPCQVIEGATLSQELMFLQS